jgi:DNA polymerase-3 subunit chi
VARVDFHSQVGDKLTYTCRLVRKIFSLASASEPIKKIVIVGSVVDIDQLNQRLWGFSSEDFLPHCLIDEESAEFTPILLATTYDEDQFQNIPHQDVFIHLGQDFLEGIEQITNRFDRVIEVVSLEENEVAAGRQRYKQYRSMGVELFNHDQKGAK